MAKLHELLAAEKTPTAAYNQLHAETLKKFAAVSHYFVGHSKSLKMIEESEQAKAEEAKARDEKPVTTTVYDTLEYVFDVWAGAEDIQYQKNSTNRRAVADVMWEGEVFLKDMPVDELLGLESRLQRTRELFMAAPTLDASRSWEAAPAMGRHVWQATYPDVTTKTEKVMTPVVMAEATDKHPAQVSAVTKDVVVGTYTTIQRAGSITALQKAEAIKRIDRLMVEVKQARMRANETETDNGKIAAKITAFLLEPLA